jgi:hypothetical protein
MTGSSAALAGLRIAGLAALLAAPGCAHTERSASPEQPAKGAQEQPAAAKPAEARPEEVKPAADIKPATPAVAESPPAAEAPGPKAEAPPAKAQPDAAKSAAPAAPVPTKEAKATPPAKPAAPPLDLASLERRLKDTEAIGFMTKLTLKNQVDELLERFEAHYDGTNKVSLTELRQPFDLLILKVLSLLQDRDAALAGSIATSREAMWGILSDPAKFRSFLNQNRS